MLKICDYDEDKDDFYYPRIYEFFYKQYLATGQCECCTFFRGMAFGLLATLPITLALVGTIIYLLMFR